MDLNKPVCFTQGKTGRRIPVKKNPLVASGGSTRPNRGLTITLLGKQTFRTDTKYVGVVCPIQTFAITKWL